MFFSRVDAKLVKKESQLEVFFFMLLWRSVGKVNYPNDPNDPNKSRGGITETGVFKPQEEDNRRGKRRE